MPTQIIDGFSLNAARPIDSRMVTNGLASRNGIQYKYEGLRVYDLFEKAGYVWINGAWAPDGGGSAGGSSVSIGIPDYIAKFTNTGLTQSVIRETKSGSNKYVGINVATTLKYQLEVGGTLYATTYLGPQNSMNGNMVESASLSPVKITPMPSDGKSYLLKCVNGSNSWQIEAGAALNVSVMNETQATEGYITFVTNLSGGLIYVNNIDADSGVRINPSLGQILGSIDGTNPTYAFKGKTTSGLYMSSQNYVGLTSQAKKFIESNGSSTNIYGTSINLTAEAVNITSTAGTLIGGFDLTVTSDLFANSDISVAGQSNLNTLVVSGSSTLNTLTVNGATLLKSTLTVNGASTLNSTLNVKGTTTIDADFQVSSSKIVTLTDSKIKALYASNEFNFVNDDNFNSDVYFNYRGVQGTGKSINSYIFSNGRYNLTDPTGRNNYASITTGGIKSWGIRPAGNSADKSLAAASFYAADVGLHIGGYNLGFNNDYGMWLHTQRSTDNVSFPLYIMPNGGRVGIGKSQNDFRGGLVVDDSGIQMIRADRPYLFWRVSSITGTNTRWVSDTWGSTSGNFAWMPSSPYDRVLYVYLGGNISGILEAYILLEAENLDYGSGALDRVMVARCEGYNSMMAIIPANQKYVLYYEATSVSSAQLYSRLYSFGR